MIENLGSMTEKLRVNARELRVNDRELWVNGLGDNFERLVQATTSELMESAKTRRLNDSNKASGV